MATSNFTEEEILFRRRARRRLVGAVVLVVTVIAVVPMILPENKPQQDTQQIEIRIPPQDASGYAPKITPAPSPNPASGTAPAGIAPPGTAPNGESANSQPAIVDVNPTAPLPAAPVSDLVPTPAPTEKPPVAATTPPRATKEPVKSSVTTAQPNTPSKAGAAAKSSYFVQYGAFSELKNAKLRQAELKTKGVTTFTEVTTTAAGDKIRVRSGPYSGREDAEKVRLKVKPLDSKLVVTGNNP